MTEPEPTPQERLDAAQAAFAAATRVLPAGIQGFQLPPWTETTASANAAAALMLAKGIITEQEFVDAKTTALAELIEAMATQAREMTRSVSGLVLPGARQPH